jgi:hypothetical protein
MKENAPFGRKIVVQCRASRRSAKKSPSLWPLPAPQSRFLLMGIMLRGVWKKIFGVARKGRKPFDASGEAERWFRERRPCGRGRCVAMEPQFLV